MTKRIIVSGSDKLMEFGYPEKTSARQIRLDGAGTLCASAEKIFCACGNVIWQLDSSMLVPTALFAGGPGINRMHIFENSLIALCAEADSVLLMDAASGTPLVVNRVGLYPRDMALDETAGVLAVAGGETGEAVLLSARSLHVLQRLPMPGMVYAVALKAGMVHALCLNDTLDTTLVTVFPGGIRQSLALLGMPGMIRCRKEDILCATEGYLYTVSRDGMRILSYIKSAGRPARMIQLEGDYLILDPLAEAVYALSMPGGCWRLMCSGAKDICDT